MNSTYCNLKEFSKSYETIHGPLSFLVCVFGSIANILNICVLTTKEMRWPTNLILTHLAITDLLVMLEYIPFTLHRYLNDDSKNFVDNYSYNWALFMKFHALFSLVLHFISCCLTVLLAVWRYVAITNPHNCSNWCGMRRTFYIIILTYLACPLICSPLFLSLQIMSYNQTCDTNGRILNKPELVNFTGSKDTQTIYVTNYINDNYKDVSFWIYSVVLKLVPCVLLTHLSQKLITVLLETKKRRTLLMNSNLRLNHITSGAKNVLNKKFEKDKQADRTSGMLVAILLLFLLTEFPQAILGLLSATKGDRFFKECYSPLGRYTLINLIYQYLFLVTQILRWKTENPIYM